MFVNTFRSLIRILKNINFTQQIYKKLIKTIKIVHQIVGNTGFNFCVTSKVEYHKQKRCAQHTLTTNIYNVAVYQYIIQND